MNMYPLRVTLFFSLFLMFLLSTTDCSAQSFSMIETSAIEKAQVDVVRYMRKNQLYRYAFFGASTVVVSGCLYTLLAASGNPEQGGLTININAAQIIIPETEKLKIIQQCTAALKDNTEALGTSTSFKSLVKQQGIYVVLSLMISGALSPFGKYLKRVDNLIDTSMNKLFGTKNMDWFVQTNTQLNSMMDLVCKDAANNQNSQALINSWNILMHELTKVLGFIKYRSTIIATSFPAAAQRMDQYICAIQQQVAQVVDQLTHDVANQVEVVTKFKDCVVASLKDFSSIDALHA